MGAGRVAVGWLVAVATGVAVGGREVGVALAVGGAGVDVLVAVGTKVGVGVLVAVGVRSAIVGIALLPTIVADGLLDREATVSAGPASTGCREGGSLGEGATEGMLAVARVEVACASACSAWFALAARMPMYPPTTKSSARPAAMNRQVRTGRNELPHSGQIRNPR